MSTNTNILDKLFAPPPPKEWQQKPSQHFKEKHSQSTPHNAVSRVGASSMVQSHRSTSTGVSGRGRFFSD